MYRKRILSLLLAVVMMLGMLPAAFAAQGDTTGGLVKLNKTDFDLELTRGTLDPDREEYTHFWEYGGEISYLELEEADHHCHGLSRYLTEDSEPGEAVFTIRFPGELSEASEPVMRWCRFRPGDHTGDTVEDEVFEPLTVEDGSFSVDILEEDSPWVYKFQFGDGEDENFEPITYTYEFELSVQRFKYMTWDDVKCNITSGTLDYDYQEPSTDELYICDSENYYYMNYRTLYVYGENPEAAFTISRPSFLAGVSDLVARVYALDSDTEEFIAGNSVEIPATEEGQAVTIQFGTGTDENFTPLTYEYPFVFSIQPVETLTWENISWDESIQADYADMEPYSAELKEKTLLDDEKDNKLYLPVTGKEPGDTVTITVACPENLWNNSGIRAKYHAFEKGNYEYVEDFEDKTLTNGAFTFDVEVYPLGQKSSVVHRFWFRDDDDRVSGVYDLDITVVNIDSLTWDNVSYIASDDITVNTADIVKYPAPQTNELVPDVHQSDYGGNAYIIPVTAAPSGSRMTFQVSCPDGWKTNGYDIYAEYITNLRGAQTSDTATVDTLKLNDGILSIPVDVSKAFPTRWHRIAFYQRDDNGNRIAQTSQYTFDFVARDDSGTFVDARVAVEGDAANSTVTDGAIQSVITANPDDSSIFIKAAYTDSGLVPNIPETNVTLSNSDANAVIEADKSLEIYTPLGTVNVPAEAVAQAMGEDGTDASLRLKVQARESESIAGYNDVNVEIVEVTLHRVVSGVESGAVPIRLADGEMISVTVLTQKQTPVIVVYLPPNGGPVFHARVNNVNDRVTFTTSHLSEFALLTYEEARRLGVISDPTPEPGDSGSTEPAERRSRVVKSSASSSAGTAGAVNTGRTSNGSVTASPSSASRGDTVTLTVAPDAGYRLESITVTGEDGKAIALNKTSDTVYTFTMPSGDVEIAARFVSDGSAPVLSGGTFSDVASTDWFAAAVAYVAENGMMAGNNGSFSPNGSMTRGMIAQVLYNMEKASGASAASAFSDVQAGDWFADAVAWAVTQGYMSGYGNGRFGPEDAITREQLATLFHNYAQKKGYDVSAVNDLSAFSDRAAAADWSAEAVRWAVGAGLLSGKSGGRLDPTGTASRAEVAQILMRFAQNIAK